MILERSVHDGWLSNSWLVAAGPGGDALVVDAGAPAAPLLSAVERHGLRVTRVILTHHHHDHVAETSAWVERGAVACAHEREAELLPFPVETLRDDAVVPVGGLAARVLWVPGHTQGQVNVAIDGVGAFTGDTLFAGSVGGTRAPGHGTFDQLRSSILLRLMTLPADTPLHPGHGPSTTVGAEWLANPFIRAWREVDAVLDEPCMALGEPARLLVWARDYDGGFKAQVRFERDGSQAVVPGSRVVRGR